MPAHNITLRPSKSDTFLHDLKIVWLPTFHSEEYLSIKTMESKAGFVAEAKEDIALFMYLSLTWTPDHSFLVTQWRIVNETYTKKPASIQT